MEEELGEAAGPSWAGTQVGAGSEFEEAAGQNNRAGEAMGRSKGRGWGAGKPRGSSSCPRWLWPARIWPAADQIKRGREGWRRRCYYRCRGFLRQLLLRGRRCHRRRGAEETGNTTTPNQDQGEWEREPHRARGCAPRRPALAVRVEERASSRANPSGSPAELDERDHSRAASCCAFSLQLLLGDDLGGGRQG